jgi:hypothetical protein
MRQNYIQAMMAMTEQFAAVMLQQMQIVGTLLDAKHELETQLIYQEIEARTHKEFHPEVELCVIGTNVRSLAASERKAKINARVVNEIMLDRETLNGDIISANGFVSDIESRYYKFLYTYCDGADFNGVLGGYNPGEQPICQIIGQGRPNNDVDFTRVFDTRLTLNIDFTDNALTADEQDIIALTYNLFSHQVFSRINPDILLQDFAEDEFMDMRSVIAIRGIIRNSWGHIIGMRSIGTAASASFVRAIYEQMGVPNAELDAFVGQYPSYFAQMELLTKKLYQNPDFYTNLYTKPANVDRTGVAIQAIQLMHNRDRYEAALRKEMLISMLLELKLREHQESINDGIIKKMAVLFIDPI